MRKEIPENETFNKYGNAARLIELAEFENRGAVEVISKENVPYGAKFVTGRFVYTIKEKPTSESKPRTNAHIDHIRKLDARLCARGFTETMEASVAAPTISLHTVRAIFAITPIVKWRVRIVDISRAFLQSGNLERELHMRPPRGAENNSNLARKLIKPIYGLRGATKRWRNSFEDFVLENGAV